MRRKPTLLVVDDHVEAVVGLKEMVQALPSPWHVEIITSVSETLEFMSSTDNTDRFPRLVSVDLGLDPLPFKPDIGLALLRTLRSEFKSARLVVHSGIDPEPTVVREILAMPASYVQVRDHSALRTLADMVPLLALGYIVHSPSVSALFSACLSNSPDPLDEEDWKLLRLNASRDPYLSQQEIAEQLPTDVGQVNRRMQDIAARLRTGGFVTVEINSLSTPNKYRRPLEQFYREFHVRFCRS